MKETIMANVTTRNKKEVARGQTPFERFRELTRRIVAVPKSEIVRASKRKRKKKSKPTP